MEKPIITYGLENGQVIKFTNSQKKMKKGRTIRFNKIVYVYKHPPIPLVDKEDSSVTEPAMHKGGKVTLPTMHREKTNVTEPAMHKRGKVTLPAMYREHTNVTEPVMHKDDKVTLPTTHTDYINVTELARYKDGKVTLPAMHTEDGGVTKPAMPTEDSDVTGPAVPTEDSDVTGPAVPTEDSHVTGPAVSTEEGHVTGPAVSTEDGHVTGPAVPMEDGHVTGPAVPMEDSHVTGPALPTEDGNVTGPAVPTEDGNVTGPAVPTEDGDVTGSAVPTEDSDETEVARHLVQSAIITAVETVEDEYPIENIKWLTHGEFTPEKCRKQIEEFVRRRDQLKLVEANSQPGRSFLLSLFSGQPTRVMALRTLRSRQPWSGKGVFDDKKPAEFYYQCKMQIQEILRYCSTWKYQDRLVCYAKLIETRDVVHSFHYIYYVRWSLPTAQRPMIPQSAYAFFTIKFNKNKPPDAPIDVSYNFEGQSLLHRPGVAHFPENCLIYVIEAKNKLAKPFISEINYD